MTQHRPEHRPTLAPSEKGYFKDAGLDVEPLKFSGAQRVMEATKSIEIFQREFRR
jgi:ABC-type nitrate/sulfonate/bicarbonate transport system substrate-binding protein